MTRDARVFTDRRAAGIALGHALRALDLAAPVVVLGLPRGGVPPAFEVAQLLGVPLDVMPVRKVGMPGRPEFAIGAIAPNGVVVRLHNLDSRFAALAASFEKLAQAERAELDLRAGDYRAGLAPLRFTDHTVVLVDDGLATGCTMLAALRAARRAGARRIVVAAPVASREAFALLTAEADTMAILQVPEGMASVGEWYEDFRKVDEVEVRGLLGEARHRHAITADACRQVDAWWRAANYLSVGQIFLFDNPLLHRPLVPGDVKRMLLGHWGTTPGQNFIYAHLTRAIRDHDLDMIFISGPGHGGPAVVANTYLEGSYSEIHPSVSQDEAGLRKLFRQFSFPGGIPSHASPECPGSIHEGGELGYSLSHAFGAAFDNPELVVACVVGDGEAETGPLATAWHSNKFLDPRTDGAVLPILHLNGYKIANPTLLARIPRAELEQLLRGYGWSPHFVSGHEPAPMHELMATTLDTAIREIRRIQQDARERGVTERPCWPMIVLESPKGWTGPRKVDGKQVEGTFRSHQVPLHPHATPAHLQHLEDWLRSYRPDELFDERGCLRPAIAALAPRGARRMGANPHANGGQLLRDLRMPDYRDFALALTTRGAPGPGDTRVLGPFLASVVSLNEESRNFRIFGPDETASNGLGAVFDATARQWDATCLPGDEHLAATGRVLDSMLSEHQCEGWLEGYLLTGRHGLFNCYEAFIHIIDSMFNQHAKWLKVAARLPWRHRIASLNYLLASHVWRQDHNGFSHQDPGFIDHVVNKKSDLVRVYLPPDANCLLSVMDHCLRSRNYVNVVIAGKHPAPQWLTMTEAQAHCAAGIGVWDWAGNDGGAPDLVMACCGDVPTLETLAAVSILREHLPALRVRVVNVVDLMKLQPPSAHPHGLGDAEFDAMFTPDCPVIFAFHGYPALIHRLTYRRTNHENFHVRGYQEEGTITTPFDMTVLNELDRYHLVESALARLPRTGEPELRLIAAVQEKLATHSRHIREFGEDMPEIREWRWPLAR